jgi:radical SAM superfamily enzyme YgiQ (UPF0313 family)
MGAQTTARQGWDVTGPIPSRGMDVLLVSTYELGHQPVHLASPAAALRAAGHSVRCLDLSVDAWDAQAAWWAEAVALSVPMHTAMRLAVRAARELRGVRPDLPLAFYGLYAPVSRDLTVRGVADAAIGGEYEPALVRWVDAVAQGGAAASSEAPVVELGRTEFRVPTRNLLPPLDRYAHLQVDGEERPVGAVEASHGCAHECRHCPIPVWYHGRIRLVPRDVVLADIEQLVRMGARHVTFADPDFLNGWRHSLRLVREMHGAFPDLTFDCTTKVEHVLRHADLWPELARSGCLFVVSAFETMNDEVLARLDKGHTAADAARAVEVLRPGGIEIRPSFLPFTPWTTPTDLVDIIDFVVDADLVGNVDPVQYTSSPRWTSSKSVWRHWWSGARRTERASWPRFWTSTPRCGRPWGSGALSTCGRSARGPWRGGPGSPNPGSVERSPPRASSALSRAASRADGVAWCA